MPSDRQSYAQRELRKELLRFASANARLLATSVAAVLAVCVVPLVMGSPAYVTGAVHAFSVTALVAVVWFGFLFAGGGALLIAGTYGEAYTREEIAKAVKQAYVWSSVDNLEVGSQDVDHLVLSPGGVLALETKWRFRGAQGQWLSSSVAQAQAAARKARSILLSHGIGERHVVRPVLVVWGGGRTALPDWQVVDGVDVVRGDALATWLARFERGPLAQDNAALLHDRVTAFVADRETHRTSLHTS